MKSQKELVDKTYKLRGDKTPLSFILQHKSTLKSPLLWFDENKGINRTLRYARNQNSPFEDEQDGNPILEPIVFEDGFLRVPKNNPVLQEFLSYHPYNGKQFVEVNKEKNAQEELEKEDMEFEARLKAQELGLDELEVMIRGLLGMDPDKMSTAEMKRDIRKYAKNNPEEFMNSLSDPDLDLQSTIVEFFEEGLLSERNQGRDVHFNLKENKKRMLQVPHGKERNYVIASYFKTNEGVEILKMLEDQLDSKE